MLDGGAPWYRCYETLDGKYIAVGALEEKFYLRFLEAIGFEDPNEEFHQFGVEKWPQFTEKIAAIIKEKTRDQWTEIFTEVDACVTPVLEITEVAQANLHRSRDAFNAQSGLPNPAPKLSRTAAKRPPEVVAGSVTRTILSELGYNEDSIQNLVKEGVVDDPDTQD